jgi:hypothetical protein
MREVLEFWHSVEFFQSFDLQQKMDQGKVSYFLYDHQVADKNLPWIDPVAFRFAGGEEGKTYRYHLYLFPFDRSELTRLCREKIQGPKNAIDEVEWQEKLEGEGKTCFGKIVVEADGTIDFNNLSLSTLPWALGHLAEGRLSRLCQANFESDREKLHFELEKIQLKENHVDSEAIFYFLQCLAMWSRFFPKDKLPLLGIELREKKVAKKKILLQDLTSNLPRISLKEEGDEEEEEDRPERDWPILNSFYIRDIERVLLNGFEESSLAHYIKKQVDHLDLESTKGSAFVFNTLHPKFSRMGRWPSSLKQTLPLMQHFAINNTLRKHGLNSINGPPGTGKTTLIRELVAHQIVMRSMQLSLLNHPKQAFIEQRVASFGGGVEAVVHVLDPRLTGFEMVIASSNNKAVENLSRELPKRSSVFQSVEFLSSVANKVFAPHDKKGKIKPLESHQKCWGLISAALGNWKNCRKFLERAFFLKEDKADYQTIWEWAKNRKGKTFDQAKGEFRETFNRWNQTQTLLCTLADLHTFFFENPNEEDFLSESKELEEIEEILSQPVLTRQKKHFEEQLKTIDEWIATLDSSCPPKSKEWEEKKNQAMEKKCHYLQLLIKENERLHNQAHQKEIAALQKKRLCEILQAKKEEWEQKTREYESLKSRLNVTLPPYDLCLKNPEHQVASYYQNEKINQELSDLFKTSITLHEVWLGEVLQKGGGFSGNMIALSQMLSGKAPTLEDTIVPIWQSLFFLVPVVSTTFASFSRLFGTVPEATFGWVIIDEGGQAIPQSAVGALWRGKQAAIFGDPLQIEPVMTIPPSLVDSLAKDRIGADWHRFTPTLVSVQTLADRANPFGVFLEKGWIGTPLRVHRRCADPMFSIANQIAYGGSMVHQVEENSNLSSFWYHIPGEAVEKQYVPAQGEFVIGWLKEYVQEHNALPHLYIISPFRKIRDRLARRVREEKLAKRVELDKWIEERIGTIHTFQGKEEEHVFIVLGADSTQSGSIAWACNKPNLLNVALTRAKATVSVVGDVKLWGTQPFFQTLKESLKVVEV